MRALIPLLPMLALTACGASGDQQSAAASPDDLMNGAVSSEPAQAARSRGTADLEEIDCGSVEGQRGEEPDVVGVTIGMSAEQAYAKIACSNRALRVQYSEQGSRLPPMPGGQRPRTAITAERDGETLEAALVGLPGQERVVSIRREIRFPDGQQPQVAELEQQLRAKYGSLEIDPLYRTALRATLVRQHARMTIGGPSGPCAPAIHGRLSLYAHCGLSISVYADRANNELLARNLIVAITDGAFGRRLMAESIQQARAAAERQNSEEAEKAAGRAPSL